MVVRVLLGLCKTAERLQLCVSIGVVTVFVFGCDLVGPCGVFDCDRNDDFTVVPGQYTPGPPSTLTTSVEDMTPTETTPTEDSDDVHSINKAPDLHAQSKLNAVLEKS